MKKVFYLAFNILLVSFIIGAATFFFDDDYSNDHFGWLLLLAFWAIRSLYDLINNLQKGNKKLATVDLLLLIFAVYFLLTRGMDYIIN